MARSDLLVDADWVEAYGGDPGVVLVEVDEDTAAFDGGHLRNAIKIDWKTDLQHPERRDFIDRAGFEALLSRCGISNHEPSCSTAATTTGSPPTRTGISGCTGTRRSSCWTAGARGGSWIPAS